MSDIFRASVRGAGRNARSLSRAARGIQSDMISELRRASVIVLGIFKEEAPSETGLLGESLNVRFSTTVSRPKFTIGHDASLLEEHKGYDYMDVTRFGHRVDRIVPQNARALAIHSADEFYANTDDGASIRSSVPGFDPIIDWVGQAAFAAEREVDAAAGRLERSIDTRILR